MQITLNNTGSGELYLQIMKAICGKTDGKSVVDLMAHHSPFVPKLGFSKRTYVDIQDRPLDFKEEQKYFIKSDVFEFLEKGGFYDVMICSDGIEHLTIEQGRQMVSLMERFSEKQIIFTPLGDYMVTTEQHPDQHRSGWMPDYFEGWAGIVLPNFHPSLGTGLGAFFVFHCENIIDEFNRVKNELAWIK